MVGYIGRIVTGLLLAAMTTATASAATPLLPWHDATDVTLALESLSGEPVSLADQGGQVVLVHFFATWCEPCREELASLDRLARRLEGLPFAILAVDSGEPEVRIRRFFEKTPVSFPILLDPDSAALRAWSVTALPTSFILERNGQPLLKAEGDVAWDSDTVAGLVERAIGRAKKPEDRPQISFETIPENTGDAR